MDANYIVYETLVASRDAADWAFWTMLASWMSVLATIITLCFAYRALSTWREQEKIRVKLDFRIALKRLKSALLFMPLNIDPKEIEQEREQVITKWIFKDVDLITQEIEAGEQNVKRYDELLSLYDNCQSSWLATEHLFDNTELAKVWMLFEEDFEKYISGVASRESLAQMLKMITETRFVFEQK
ncbi:hypothetical protein [Obesumbacterium proteus]|uniref:hypothetical protein n=1 Tax=Obesumbacterium proteus TaxID=82983 RepID=UPI00242F2E97|nr:hypothetical protein [Obesumbacterium proteus]